MSRQRVYVWCTTSLSFGSLYISFFFIAAFLQSVGFSAEKAGIGLGLYGLAMIPTRILIGIVSSKTGQHKLLIQIGLAALLAGQLTVFAPAIGLLSIDAAMLLHRSLLGIGASFYVIQVSLFKSFFPKEEVPNAMAWITTAYAVPQIVATLVGGYAIGRWGWEAPFLMGFGAAVVALVLISLVKGTVPPEHEISIKQLACEVWDLKLLVSSFLGMVCFFVAFGSYYSFAQNWAKDALNIDEQGLSRLMLWMLIPFAGTLLSSGRFQRLFGPQATLATSMFLLGIGVILIPSSPDFTTTSWLYVIGGVGLGLAFPTAMGQSVQGVPEHRVPWAMAIFQCIYALGIMLGPVAGGVLVSRLGYELAFLGLGSIALVSIVPIYFMGMRNRLEPELAGPAAKKQPLFLAE